MEEILLVSDFAGLVKTRGKELEKRNKALSISDFKKLRSYLLQNYNKEFYVMVLLALETGARRGWLRMIQLNMVLKLSAQLAPQVPILALKQRGLNGL